MEQRGTLCPVEGSSCPFKKLDSCEGLIDNDRMGSTGLESSRRSVIEALEAIGAKDDKAGQASLKKLRALK